MTLVIETKVSPGHCLVLSLFNLLIGFSICVGFWVR
jgi:hypothetical protein